MIFSLDIAVQMHVDFHKTLYIGLEPLPTFSIEEKKIHFFWELWPFWQIFPPTFFFFLKNLFSLPLSTHFIGGLYRFDFCNRCEMVDDLQQNNMKRKKSLENMLALLYYSSYIWWSFKVVWSFSFSSFIFLSLASTTIKLVLVVISIVKENYLMLKDPTLNKIFLLKHFIILH